MFRCIACQGDVARLYDGPRLLVDNFFNGNTWTVGLRRFLDLQQPDVLNLEILPLRADAPIYLEKGREPAIPEDGQIDRLEGIQLIPEYRMTLSFP